MKQKLIITAALLALLLTACGKQQDAGPAKLSGAAAYTSDVSPLDLPLMELTASASGEGALYLAGLEEEPAEVPQDGEDSEITSSSGFTVSTSGSEDGDFTFSSGAGRAALYRMDTSIGKPEKLAGYAPGEEGASVASVVPCEDGSLWVLERVSGGLGGLIFDPGNPESMGNAAASMGDITWASQVWRKLDATGAQELERIDITDLAGKLGAETVADTRMDREGRLYAASGSTVTVLDKNLTVLSTCKGLETIEQLISVGSGVGAVAGDENGRTVYPVDPESQSLGKARPLTGSANRLYGGNGKYDFLYTSGDSLYGWPTGGTAPEKLLGWSGAGVDKSQVKALLLQSDDSGLAVLRESDFWSGSYATARLTPAEEDAERTVLTLATMGLDSDTRARVLEFNRTSGTHRIEVRDYSEYNTAGDISAGLGKLNTEILAGNMPDLLDVSSGIPLRRYASRGMLEDLWPYIESDGELGRDGVMERPLRASEIGGKLYQVFSRFTIETAAGAPSAVGDKMGWTLEELKAALSRQPAGCGVLGAGETRSSILETLFADRLDQFVDWETGKARFDSPEFQAILEFCASFSTQAPASGEAADDDYTRVANGEQLLLPVHLNDLQSIQLYRALLGGGVTFVGYPGEGGAVTFGVEGGMAMSASCADKEVAWNFLRQTLLPAGENSTPHFDFPVNRSDFERAAEKSMALSYLKDETGNTVTGPDGEPILEGTAYVFVGGQVIELKPAAQDDYDQVMALYEAADSLASRDDNIWSIVRECAGAYFTGDQSAQSAAQTIQNRVELYLNEQR